MVLDLAERSRKIMNGKYPLDLAIRCSEAPNIQ